MPDLPEEQCISVLIQVALIAQKRSLTMEELYQIYPFIRQLSDKYNKKVNENQEGTQPESKTPI